MGYGSRALQALNAFYSGEYYNFDADVEMGEGGLGKVSRRKGVDDQEVGFFPFIIP
jgi:N-acetyltransferase 10